MLAKNLIKILLGVVLITAPEFQMNLGRTVCSSKYLPQMSGAKLLSWYETNGDSVIATTDEKGKQFYYWDKAQNGPGLDILFEKMGHNKVRVYDRNTKEGSKKLNAVQKDYSAYMNQKPVI